MSPLAILKTVLGLVPLVEAIGRVVTRIARGKPERDPKKRKAELEASRREADRGTK
jgi:hypothetical protein